MSIEEIINLLDTLAIGAEDCADDDMFAKTEQEKHKRSVEALRVAISLLRTHPEAQPNEPLTLEELKNRNKPVFVAVSGFAGGGYWCLCKYGRITPPNCISFWVVDRPSWKFFDRPPKED